MLDGRETFEMRTVRKLRRIAFRIAMRVMCTEMCIDLCMDMCTDTCTEICLEMSMNMCADVYRQVHEDVYVHAVLRSVALLRVCCLLPCLMYVHPWGDGQMSRRSDSLEMATNPWKQTKFNNAIVPAYCFLPILACPSRCCTFMECK